MTRILTSRTPLGKGLDEFSVALDRPTRDRQSSAGKGPPSRYNLTLIVRAVTTGEAHDADSPGGGEELTH